MISFSFVLVLLFSGLQPGSAATNEPACAKFPYEELLWKMLKIENKMEQWEIELRKLQETVLSFFVNQKDEMKRSLEIQDQKLEDCRTDCNNCMEQIRNMTSGSTEKQIVAFSANTTAAGKYNDNQTVIFPRVLLNEGNGYNPVSGIFTAPVAGLYHFSAQVCNKRTTAMVISIFHGVSKIATGTVYENENETCMSLNGVVMMEVGDVASVRSTWCCSEMSSDDFRRPSFTGILIHVKQNDSNL